MSTGSDLEAAVQKAANHYQLADRSELAKQHTPRLHGGRYTRRSPIDFKGWYRVGGRRDPLYVECKATSDGLIKFTTVKGSGDAIDQVQFEALHNAVRRGIHCLLIVDMVSENEVYVVDVLHLINFAQAPWRKSISLAWLRAFGYAAKVTVDRNRKYVWYLDTIPHPQHDVAYLACIEEKKRAKGRVVELFPVERAPSRKQLERRAELAARPRPGTDEYRAYIQKLAAEGAERAAGQMPRTWANRRGRR